jgi:hypothetical protein
LDHTLACAGLWNKKLWWTWDRGWLGVLFEES